jgi:DNA polymerase-1
MYNTLIVDSSHLAYRTYFALVDAEAECHLVQGFIRSLVSIKNKYDIKTIITTWDSGHTLKSKLYPNYKQKQEIMSESQREDFFSQMNLLRDVVSLLGIKSCSKQGVEADDIIACLCIHPEIYNIDKSILILSGDHDLHPLLSLGYVDMLKPHKEEIYTADTFREEFPDLEPNQYHLIQSLAGCSGDKIPGVKGIGTKHAANLIKKYGNLENLKNTNDTGRIINLVKDSWDMVELSYQLVTFEEVDPILEIPKVNLSRAKKILYSNEMNMLLDQWSKVSNLAKLQG